jgi:hypothetical protein
VPDFCLSTARQALVGLLETIPSSFGSLAFQLLLGLGSMSRLNWRVILLLVPLLACYAQEDRSRTAGAGPGTAVEKSGEPHEQTRNASARTEGEDSSADYSAEVYQDVMVPAGKSVPITSTIDFSGAASVAVTIRCSVCGTSAGSLANAGLVLQALWAVTTSDYFVATENKSATAFPYWDNGGAIFSVYGGQFRLNLQNKGSQNIVLQQVTVFRRLRQ